MTFIKRNLKFVVTFAILAVLLAFGTFFDLQISHAIADLDVGTYYSTNLLGVIFESFGEMPVYIVPTIALGVLFFYLKKVSKAPSGLKIAAMIFIVVFSIGFNYYGSHKLLKYYDIHVTSLEIEGLLRTGVEGALGVIFTAIWFFIASLVKEKYLKSAAICALIVVFTTALSQGAVQLIKPIFGRARYRLLNMYGDFSEYTPWYVVNSGRAPTVEQLAMGIKDGYKSFPSGHTAAAAVVFSLMSIPTVFKLNAKTDRLVTAATCLVVFIVALSRIVMGAHYLTDVTMGALLTLISYAVSQAIVLAIVKNASKKSEKAKKTR